MTQEWRPASEEVGRERGEGEGEREGEAKQDDAVGVDLAVAVSGIRALVVSEPDLECLEGVENFSDLIRSGLYPDLTALFDGDSRLKEVSAYADRLASHLGPHEPAFFKSPVLMKYFLEYLQENIAWFENRIVELKKLMDRARGTAIFERLPSNWEDVLRKSFYCAAFLHFGQLRAGEKEQNGRSQHYLKHPMRAMFDHLAKKSRVFDLLEWVTTALHDTLEDFRKGLVGILFMKGENLELSDLYADQDEVTPEFKTAQLEASRNKQTVRGTIALMVSDLDSDLGGECADVFPLAARLDFVTKRTSDRGKAWVDMMMKIVNSPDEEIKLSAFAALLNIKIGADRMDNSRTAGPKSKVVDETRHIALRMVDMLREANRADWFRDYLFCVNDPDKYRQLMQMRQEAKEKRGDDFEGEHVDIELQFRKDFLSRLRAESGIEALEEGKDYVLEFREASLRFRHPDEETDSLLAGDAARGFRNYLIFHPTGHNPTLAGAAKSVFQQMLHPPSVERFYPEIEQSRIGRVITDAGNKGSERRRGGIGDHEDYGRVVWGIWESEEDCSLATLGLMYILRYYRKEAQRRELYMTIGGKKVSYDEIRKMALDFVDSIKPFVFEISDNYRDHADLQLQAPNTGYFAAQTAYLHKKVMTLLLPKRVVRARIDFGNEGAHEFDFEVPINLPDEFVFGYAHPQMIGKFVCLANDGDVLRFEQIDKVETEGLMDSLKRAETELQSLLDAAAEEFEREGAPAHSLISSGAEV